MRLTKKLILYLLIGSFANLCISIAISSLGDFANAKKTWHTWYPEIDQVRQGEVWIDIDVVYGMGTMRRAWSSVPEQWRGHGKSPLEGQRQRENKWFLFPKANGPISAWTVGDRSMWGDLYSTKLTTLESVKAFEGFESAAGFPALSFWHEFERSEDLVSYRTPGAFAVAQSPSMQSPGLEIRAIPYRPIWRGLIFNTIFYAILAFVTHRLYRTIREHRRFTKGKCPKCKYDLNANFAPGCPECGWRRNANPTPA